MSLETKHARLVSSFLVDLCEYFVVDGIEDFQRWSHELLLHGEWCRLGWSAWIVSWTLRSPFVVYTWQLNSFLCHLCHLVLEVEVLCPLQASFAVHEVFEPNYVLTQDLFQLQMLDRTAELRQKFQRSCLVVGKDERTSGAEHWMCNLELGGI